MRRRGGCARTLHRPPSNTHTADCNCRNSGEMKVLLVMTLVAAMSCQDALPDPHELIKDAPRHARFVSCMQGKDTCEPFAEQLRAQLPQAIKTSCAECPKALKTFIRVVTLDLIKTHPEAYKTIEDYYDKERKYEKSFEEFLRSDD